MTAASASSDEIKRLNNPKITQYLKSHTKMKAIETIAEANNCYKKVEEEYKEALSIKDVLKFLRRAVNNPALIEKLPKKISRFDNDTIDILGLEKSGTLPSIGLINQRITELEDYPKLRNTIIVEPIRYHCGILRLIYTQYGQDPQKSLDLRKFVVTCLEFAGIGGFPDPTHHGDLLDDWINTAPQKLTTNNTNTRC